MTETQPIQIRWPKGLAIKVREIAAKRHTTVSEITRQAVIDQYHIVDEDAKDE